jgi:hypothetical protein
MTKTGKILVVATFVASVMFAAWSMALYFTRIDWTDTPAKEGNPAGMLVARKARVQELLAASRPAENSWREARKDVIDREVFRAEDRAFYKEQIDLVFNAPANDQLNDFDRDKDGQRLLQPDPRSKAHFLLVRRKVNDRAGNPLHSLKTYAKRYADNVDALTRTGKDLDVELKKDADLTVELAGGTLANGMVIEKGLRKRIEDERLKGIDMLAEYEIVRPLLIKTVGDSEFLLARKRQLEERIKKLEGTPVQ